MKRLLLLPILVFCIQNADAQNLYFPPTGNPDHWDTISPASMGWCVNKIDSLYHFLEQENTKGFIVLKDGKIVLEKYFGTFTKDSLWYWASAGKTLTSFLTGQAQEDGYLSLSDSSSKYLGEGWTLCPPVQEDKITIWNQLTMTTGLDDGVPDNHCTLDTCLTCLAAPGTRWAYHNAPYTLLENVLIRATNHPINTYTNQKLLAPTGMTGFWLTLGYDNVFFSKGRSMARFGLLIQNKGIWNSDTLLHDTAYINQMTRTSQLFNLSYGFLWWLNGKKNYMAPGSQIVIPGSFAPSAPADMIAGLGKNGQIVSISRGKGIVFIRIGNQPSSPASEITTIFCDLIWQKLNAIMCNQASIDENGFRIFLSKAYPNPTSGIINVDFPSNINMEIEISNLSGKIIFKAENQQRFDLSTLPKGMYFLRLRQGQDQYFQKLIKE